MQTFTNKFKYGLRGFALLATMLFMGTWLNAQTTYYSKSTATNFSTLASWGANADGSGASPGAITNADNYVISNSAAVVLDASLSVRALTITSGSFTAAANTLTIGITSQNNSSFNLTGGTLTVSGATINVDGSFNVTGGTFNQSGGTIKVDGNNANTAGTSVATGTSIVGFAAATYNLTGGTIWVVDPHVSTTASSNYSFGYTPAANIALGVNHTFRFGNGASTQATANTNGFVQETYVGSGRMLYGNLIIDAGATAPQNIITQRYTTQWVGVQGNMTITSGDYRNSGTLAIAGNLVNNGTLTTTGTLAMSNSNGTGTQVNSTNAQTVSGTGIYRNNIVTASSTANFTSLRIGNSNASGVTFDARSLLCNTGGPTNTGTVSGTLTFTAGTVNTASNPLILGVSGSGPGTLTYTSGGMASNSPLRRWCTLTTIGTAANTNFFPFAIGGSSRMVTLWRTGAMSATGWIQAVHANATGFTPSVFTDGVYNVTQYTNASWSFSVGGGFNTTNTLNMGLNGTGLVVTSAAPGAAPRLVQAGVAAATHAAATGTTATPVANRTGFTLAQVTTGPHYIGINSADIGLYSVSNGDWNTGSTWSTGSVPTATDNPLISSGTTVTVTSGTASALTAAVAGTLTVSGGTLNITGASTTGISVNSGANLNVSGGTVNIGLQTNVNNNRRLLVNGTLNVSSGNLNVEGNINFSTTGFYTQSGGTISIDGNGTTASSTQELLSMNQTPSGFNVTGGTLVFVDPPATAISTIYYNSPTGDAVWGAGHTTQFGDGISTTTGPTNGFNANLWVDFAYLHLGNVIVAGGGSNRFLQTTYTTFPVNGNFTVNAGSDARLGALYVGGNLTNNGTLSTTTSLNMAIYRYNGGISAVTSAQTIGGSGTYANLLTGATANLTSFYIRNSNATGVTMNIPLTMSGTLTMFQGKLNTTSTNILTMYSTSGNVSIGTTTAGWVNGPMARRVPASTAFNSFFATMPVGKTGANYITINSAISAAGTVTFTAETFDSNAGSAGTSILALNANRRWDVNVAGTGVVDSYAITAYDAAMASGNALVGSATAAGTYDIVGNGSSFAAAVAPLSQNLAMSTNELAPVFPLSFGFGTTGPLNVGLILASQVTGPMSTASVAAASLTSAVERFTISVTGSSGTINLTDLAWEFTGTASADVTSVSLWTGTLTAPVTQIGTTTLSAGVATFTGLTAALASGQNNFWIQVNTSGTAAIGDIIDGKVLAGSMAFSLGGGATATGSFPTADLDPAGNRYIDYCTPTYATGGTGDDITNVTLVGSSITLNNSTTGNVTPYYYFYNAVNKPDLQTGSNYTLSVSTGTDGTQYSRVWLDFNQNGVFETSESFSTGTSVGGSSTASITISVPALATLGDTRMRIRAGDDSAIPNTAACGASASAYGQTEDYIVTITAPTPLSVNSITSTGITTGVIPGAVNENLLRVDVQAGGATGALTLNSLKFTYTGTTATDIAAAGVKLWEGTAGGPITQIGTSQSLSAGTCTFSGLTSSIGSGNNYYWVTVSIAAGAVIDNVADGKIVAGDIVISNTAPAVAAGSQPTADLDPAGSRLIDYCIASQSSGSSGDGVERVVLNGNTINLDNVTTSAGTPYYNYYNSVNVPDLFQGGTYTVSVTHGTDGTQYSGVWIDFNKDGTFATTEFFSTGTSAGSSGTSNITISVPATTFIGNVRMRVRGGNDNIMLNTNACGATPWGETEDYIVELQAPPGCAANLGLLPVTATATATNATVCIGGSTTLNITTPTALPTLTGLTYEWRSDVAVGGAYSTVVATTATPLYSFAPTTTRYYRCNILCNGSFAGVSSSSVLVSVTNPQITASTGATRCGQGSVTLSATGPGTISWFDSPTGSPLATGATYSPVVTATQTFYAASRTGGVTESAGVTTPLASSGFLTTDWGIQFNATEEVTINSVDVYPVGSGNLVIGLYNAGGTQIAVSAATAVSGTGATAVVFPLGFNVQTGNNYTLRIVSYSGITDMVRDAAIGGFPYNSTSGAVSVTGGYTGSSSTSYYYFYNMSISTGCIGDKVPVVATVTPPTPLVMLPSTTTSVCAGASTSISVLSADLGYTYTWDNGLGSGASKSITPLTSGTYIVTAVNSGTGCNTTGSIAVTVNALPSPPVVSSSAPSYCPVVVDAPSLLTATATTTSTILSESFEGGAPTWTRTNNSTGGTPSAAAWTIQTSTYAAAQNISSGAAGNKFIFTDSDAQGSGGTTATLLVTPVFAIPASATAATLTFRHYYRYILDDVRARVQISVDGGATFNALSANFTAAGVDAGTPTSFATETISLTTYIGQSNLVIRFNYATAWGWFWAVDDFNITASIPTNQFSFSPAGGLFNDLATTSQYVADNIQTQVYAAPFSSTTYNVSVEDPITGCLSAPATTTVSVCSAVTDIICGASTVTANEAPPASTAVIPVYNSIGTTTGGQAGTCQAFTNDSWYKVLVPTSGDLHVYTYENGGTLLDLQQTMITIFTSSDGTCSGTLTQVSCDNGSGQGAHSYASAAGLTPGLYAFIRVATPTTAPTPAGKFKMWIMSGLYWTSTSSTNWADPANWYGGDATTPNIVPSLDKTVIIPNNSANVYPVISGTSAICAGITFRLNSIVNIPNINIPSGAELRIQSKLGTKKAFIRSNGGYASSLIPSFTGIGTLRFNEGGNNQAEVLNRVTFKGVVAVRNTVSVISNGNMRFDNNAVLLSGGVAPTDPLKNYAGIVTGDIRVTRTGSVYGGFNYWCSPITNATTASLATSYGNNLYQYDNTLAGGSIQGAWGNVISSPIPMQAGRGYIQTYAGNGTVVFTGPAREGFFNTPVTVTGSNNFNLIGNPYPSALSYDLLRGGNASLGSIYLWHSSGAAPYNTSSYVVMSGPNGGPYVVAGNPVAGFSATEIGVGQGFLAQVSSAGNIAFNSNQRVSAYPGNSTQFLDAADYSTMKVRLTSPSQSAFDAVVAFGGSGTDGVDFGLDAPRMPSSNTFELFTYIGSGEYTIQFGGALQATKVVELGTVMTAPGTYSFSLENFDNFDASVRVYIEDVKTGSYQNLKAGSPYTFVNDPSFTGTRFKLHFMAPIAYSATGSCINETNGKLLVVNPNSANPVTASLRDAQGAVIATSAPFSGEHEFANLGSGSYSLEASYDGSDVFASAVTVDGGGISSPATFVASANEVSIADAIVEFSANAPGANVFEWNFGDGSPVVTGTSTPVHAYMEPGIYTVTLKASLNGGCATAATSTVTVTDNATGLANVSGNTGFTIYPNPANEVANLLFNADLKDSEVTISITDAAGRIVSKKNVNNLRSGAIVGLDINELANGVYEVTVAGKNFRNVGRLTIAK